MWSRLMRSNSARLRILAIEELQHGDAVDVFLQIRINPRDGDANAAVALLHGSAEANGHQHDQRHHGEQHARHAGAEPQHHARPRR